MQTIQYKSPETGKWKKVNKQKASQVCAIFHMRNVRKNVLPKFIKPPIRRNKKQTVMMNIRKYKRISGKREKTLS